MSKRCIQSEDLCNEITHEVTLVSENDAFEILKKLKLLKGERVFKTGNTYTIVPEDVITEWCYHHGVTINGGSWTAPWRPTMNKVPDGTSYIDTLVAAYEAGCINEEGDNAKS